MPDPHTALVAGSAQVFFQRDFKVHQLVPFGVAHACEVEVRAGQRHGYARNIEEHESRLRAVRLHRLGLKLGILYFLIGLLAQPALHFLGGKRNGITVGVGRRPGKPPRDVLLARGRKLGAVYRDQLRFHAGQLDRLVAIIGDDDEDGQETDLAVLDGKDVCLFRQIVGIHRDRDRFQGMFIVRGIRLGGLGLRHDEIFRRPAQ